MYPPRANTSQDEEDGFANAWKAKKLRWAAAAPWSTVDPGQLKRGIVGLACIDIRQPRKKQVW